MELRESLAATAPQYVGIDVAKQAHVVCALEAPSGVIRHKSSVVEATTDGYQVLLSWLATWRASAPPEAVLTQSAPNCLVGGQPGTAGRDRLRGHAAARAWCARWAGQHQYHADRARPSVA